MSELFEVMLVVSAALAGGLLGGKLVLLTSSAEGRYGHLMHEASEADDAPPIMCQIDGHRVWVTQAGIYRLASEGLKGQWREDLAQELSEQPQEEPHGYH